MKLPEFRRLLQPAPTTIEIGPAERPPYKMQDTNQRDQFNRIGMIT